MASRIKKIFSHFLQCYTITNSVWQSLRFILKTGSFNKISIKLSEKTKINLRKNKTDTEVFLTTFFDKYHRCPFELGQAPLIIDLGSNIGLTMVDFKIQYPESTVIGVEMDYENFTICSSNISQFPDCSVVHAAIWNENTILGYDGKDEQSYSVLDDARDESKKVIGITLNQLFKEKQIFVVDYMKMDIEGAEKVLFIEAKDSLWMKRVKFLSIEVHNTSSINQTDMANKITAILEENNFIVFKSSIHWSSLFAFNKTFFSI